MSTNHDTPVTVLGMGEMGRALAGALVDAGVPVTVWNRTPGRAGALAGRGASVASTVREAVTAGPLLVVCLLDEASVHEVLDPVAAELAGRAVVNVTTTSPAQARGLAAWAADHGAAYLDGGLMAVPEMIGRPDALVLTSGDGGVAERYGDLLGRWGTVDHLGDDPGMASLVDLAMLAGMYVMFAGFFHGAAMVGAAGVPAREFAARLAPFLTAVTGAFAEYAEVIDGGDYTVPGQQSLEFSDLSDVLEASREQGVPTDVVAPVQALLAAQVAAGHGSEGFARVFEGLRSRRSPAPA
jgi:3-hydroxyisobutyrate dehydrogenase-like beta-hydroxyacid dehydrogenase